MATHPLVKFHGIAEVPKIGDSIYDDKDVQTVQENGNQVIRQVAKMPAGSGEGQSSFTTPGQYELKIFILRLKALKRPKHHFHSPVPIQGTAVAYDFASLGKAQFLSTGSSFYRVKVRVRSHGHDGGSFVVPEGGQEFSKMGAGCRD
jgi:hypothetical protein